MISVGMMLKKLSGFMNFANLLVSLSAILTLIWFHGYHYEPKYLKPHLIYLYISFSFYFIHYLYRGIISGDIRRYNQKNRLEYAIFLFILTEFVLNRLLYFSLIQVLLFKLGIENHNHVFVFSLHICLMIIVGIESGKATARSTIWKLSPPLLFILSFLVLIVIGSSLFMLPEMTASGEGMRFIDALFTSISSNCVTGLIIVDTASYFSAKGKFLLLLFIQLGGLNITAFASYFLSRYHEVTTSKKDDTIVKELMHADSLDGGKVRVMLKRVLSMALILEFAGAIMLYYQWNDVPFKSNEEKIFQSLFHAVSAFNNAGFSILENGLCNPLVSSNLSFQVGIALLIFLGGIGFTTLWNIRNIPVFISKGFKAVEYGRNSLVAVISALILIVVGAAFYYEFEHSNSLLHADISYAYVTAFFQSVTTRTAGFNTVELSSLGLFSLILMMFLMFIGGSSGSTAGGIKTSTFFLLLIHGVRKLFGSNRKIFYSSSLLNKAKSMVIYSLMIIFAGAISLYFVEGDLLFKDVLFEEFSAFGTVGLSTGITPKLSDAGKIIVMLTILIGRVGPLTLAFTLAKRGLETEEVDSAFMIG